MSAFVRISLCAVTLLVCAVHTIGVQAAHSQSESPRSDDSIYGMFGTDSQQESASGVSNPTTSHAPIPRTGFSWAKLHRQVVGLASDRREDESSQQFLVERAKMPVRARKKQRPKRHGDGITISPQTQREKSFSVAVAGARLQLRCLTVWACLSVSRGGAKWLLHDELITDIRANASLWKSLQSHQEGGTHGQTTELPWPVEVASVPCQQNHNPEQRAQRLGSELPFVTRSGGENLQFLFSVQLPPSGQVIDLAAPPAYSHVRLCFPQLAASPVLDAQTWYWSERAKVQQGLIVSRPMACDGYMARRAQRFPAAFELAPPPATDATPPSFGDGPSREPALLRRLAMREELALLANELGLVGEMVEVGVFKGDFAAAFASKWKGKRMHLVDMWAPVGEMPANRGQWEIDHVVRSMEAVGARRSDFSSNRDLDGPPDDRDHKGNHGDSGDNGTCAYTLVRRESTVAAEQYPDGFFDVIYIDASHTYSSTRLDLMAWYPKLKVGGLFAGHDYANENRDAGPVLQRGRHFFYRCGVRDAVDEFANAHGVRVQHTIGDDAHGREKEAAEAHKHSPMTMTPLEKMRPFAASWYLLKCEDPSRGLREW